MEDRRTTARWLTLMALTSPLCAGALADPPPFLPPSLQKVVEEAREKQAPDAARSADIEDLRAISEGELTLGDVIDDLGSDDLATRERASAILSDVAMWDEEVLAAACTLPQACPETRQRLRNAMLERFANSPKPAVGISMSRTARFGILLDSVQDDFPSHRTLRAGDEILKIGDVDFRTRPNDWSLLQAVVASYKPGDVVDMLILRDNEEMNVSVELGVWADLGPRALPHEYRMLRQALDMRLERIGVSIDAEEPVKAPVSRIDWNRASRITFKPPEADGMLPGGSASSIPGRPNGGVRPGDNLRASRAERAREDVKLAVADAAREGIAVQLAELERSIEQVRERINDPRTSREDRAALITRMGELTLQRQIMLQAIDAR